MAIGDDILRERLASREDRLSQQSDTLDVKASILLVVITFLAGQSADLLRSYLTGLVHWVQIGSIVLQLTAGSLLALQLRIRSYSAETSELYSKWRDELVTHYETNEENVLNELNRGIIEGANIRTTESIKINNRKADWIKWAYWSTLLSLAANLGSLAPLIFHHKP